MQPRLRKPLIASDGLTSVADLARATGLSLSAIGRLVADGQLPGVTRASDGALVGMLEDHLPTRDELMTLGLPVSDSYDPESLRSHSVPGERDRR